MNLPELPCWQAMALKRTGRAPQAQEMISAHLHKQENAAFARDAGYYKTTPFFISYMEDAQTLRRAGCDWQSAMACWAAGDRMRAGIYSSRPACRMRARWRRRRASGRLFCC